MEQSLLNKIIDENFPNLEKELDIQIHEAKRTSNYLNAKIPPRNIILKLSKFNDKERNLKASRRKKTATYNGTPIRLSADFSGETL